jgi:hypothetical protein
MGMAVKKRTKTKGPVKAAKVVRKGHTVWHVMTGGKVRRIATRRASVKAINEAMEIYGPALKSLANR